MTFTVKDVQNSLVKRIHGYYIRSGDGRLGYEDDDSNLYVIDFTVTAAGSGGYLPAPTLPSTPGGVYRATEGPHTYVLNLSPLDRELLQRISDQVTFDHQGERP